MSAMSRTTVTTVVPVRAESARSAGTRTSDQTAPLARLRTSQFCQKYDLVDPITMLISTGLRRSELLGLRWALIRRQ